MMLLEPWPLGVVYKPAARERVAATDYTATDGGWRTPQVTGVFQVFADFPSDMCCVLLSGLLHALCTPPLSIYLTVLLSVNAHLCILHLPQVKSVNIENVEVNLCNTRAMHIVGIQ